MKHIKNFLKFALITVFVEFVNTVMVGELYFLSTEVGFVLRYALVTAILIFIAFDKKYIAFSLNSWKQNIVSVIFLVFGFGWIFILAYFSGILLTGFIFVLKVIKDIHFALKGLI